MQACVLDVSLSGIFMGKGLKQTGGFELIHVLQITNVHPRHKCDCGVRISGVSRTYQSNFHIFYTFV